MTKTDPRVASAARQTARRKIAELAAFELRQHHEKMLGLYKALQTNKARDVRPEEILKVIEASREGDREAERRRWELLALAKAAGATTRQIKGASAASQGTITQRFSAIPEARAKAENVVTDGSGKLCFRFDLNG